MSKGLKPWIRKWWDVANERRIRLINKKYNRGLTPDEVMEYELLEDVAEAIISYVGKKNPMKTFNLVCSDCKEPVDLLAGGGFRAHNCPVHKVKKPVCSTNTRKQTSCQ